MWKFAYIYFCFQFVNAIYTTTKKKSTIDSDRGCVRLAFFKPTFKVYYIPAFFIVTYAFISVWVLKSHVGYIYGGCAYWGAST